MAAGSLCLNVCFLVIFTGLNLPAGEMPPQRRQARDAASSAGRPAQVNKQQRQAISSSPEVAPVQPTPEGNVAANRATMTAADVINQLNQPEAALKNHILIIEHKEITGDLKLGVGQLPVPFRVEFHNCEFTDNFVVGNVTFEQSLVFNNVTFDKAFQFENNHIKGDLQMVGVRMAHSQDPSEANKPKTTKLQLNQSQVDGDVRIRSLEANKVEAENVTAGNVIVWLAKGGVLDLDFIKLETGRLSIAASAGTRTNQLQLDGASIKETLTLQNLVFQNVIAPSLTVGKRTQFLPTTVIEKRMDLSFASLGNFDWEFPGDAAFRLPENLNIEGATFSNLHVAPVFPSPAKTQEGRESRWEQRHTDYGLVFLEKATYFESAYAAYESLLKSQGRGDAADAVYFAMRDRRRYTEWNDAATFSGRALAGMNYVIGFGHKWLFGYGRAWVYPVVWCLLFIAVGALVFRDVARMEKQDEQPVSQFSPLWYSIDLFVPVLSLGIADRWRPKNDRRFLLFYSKALSLMGLVFISAALGALTGSLK